MKNYRETGLLGLPGLLEPLLPPINKKTPSFEEVSFSIYLTE
jgi:hypothetical protein